jgi:hypothetical protein
MRLTNATEKTGRIGNFGASLRNAYLAEVKPRAKINGRAIIAASVFAGIAVGSACLAHFYPPVLAQVSEKIGVTGSLLKVLPSRQLLAAGVAFAPIAVAGTILVVTAARNLAELYKGMKSQSSQ